MLKINVAIVHGVGISTQGYAQPLIKGVRTQFNRVLRDILKTTDDYAGQLNFIPIIWDDIVAVQEAQLADIYRKEFEKRKRKSMWENLLRFGVFLAAGLIIYWLFRWVWIFPILFLPVALYYARRGYLWLRTSFASDYICDITSYQEKGSKNLILQRIEDSLRSLNGAAAVNVTFISHSLGTVIASDFVWEKEKPGQLFGQKTILKQFLYHGVAFAFVFPAIRRAGSF